MALIQLEIRDCTECPFFDTKRHYTEDSFEMEFEQSCTKFKNRTIAYVGACEKQPSIPCWCPIIVAV